ncbi:MAG: 16S rRNA (cytidine(1402)-2'-O)-methyltransferase [Gemmatimonadota bacterium]
MATLYVVATPLGNLRDLTERATQVLRTVPVVAAEDTRRTKGLLSYLGAAPQLLSFHAHSPERRVEAILDLLTAGRDVALVSDAGTPVVSDPGAELVARVRQAGFPVVPVPGPSAVTTALSASGLPSDRYLFLGFVPRKGAERKRLLGLAARQEWPVVFFEAPGRLAALLADLAELCGAGRRVVVARELTKLHEEFRAGTLGDLAAHYAGLEPLGEITVVLEGAPVPDEPAVDAEAAAGMAAELLASGMSRRDAAGRVSAEFGLSRNDAYRLVNELP